MLNIDGVALITSTVTLILIDFTFVIVFDCNDRLISSKFTNFTLLRSTVGVSWSEDAQRIAAQIDAARDAAATVRVVQRAVCRSFDLSNPIVIDCVSNEGPEEQVSSVAASDQEENIRPKNDGVVKSPQPSSVVGQPAVQPAVVVPSSSTDREPPPERVVNVPEASAVLAVGGFANPIFGMPPVPMPKAVIDGESFKEAAADAGMILHPWVQEVMGEVSIRREHMESVAAAVDERIRFTEHRNSNMIPPPIGRCKWYFEECGFFFPMNEVSHHFESKIVNYFDALEPIVVQIMSILNREKS
jgi:hypothetical protein